jgi:predicted peroxiredoxin
MWKNNRKSLAVVIGALVLCAGGCADSKPGLLDDQPQLGPGTVLLSVTSDANEDPQSVNMALTLAGFCLDENYTVAIFFNVKGVHIPTTGFSEDLAYGDHAPFKEQIRALAERGAEIHVCPVCMGDLGVEAEDIMESAFVTSKPKLFAPVGPHATVFSY